jgi:hypothetical protein
MNISFRVAAILMSGKEPSLTTEHGVGWFQSLLRLCGKELRQVLVENWDVRSV